MQTITERFKIVDGVISDYKSLSHFHYRSSRPGPYEKIYAAKLDNETVGVIVYSLPSPSCELRNIATGNYFLGLDRRSQLAMLNKKIRTISRVIIEPRFRGLGLAVRLVRETMPMLNFAMIEALAVMGRANPFFEKAGMKKYSAPMSAQCMRAKEALSLVGIEEAMLIDAQTAYAQLQNLTAGQSHFIERELKRFVQCYGKGFKTSDEDSMRFVLSKLCDRPVYYLWLNPAFSKQH